MGVIFDMVVAVPRLRASKLQQFGPQKIMKQNNQTIVPALLRIEPSIEYNTTSKRKQQPILAGS